MGCSDVVVTEPPEHVGLRREQQGEEDELADDLASLELLGERHDQVGRVGGEPDEEEGHQHRCAAQDERAQQAEPDSDVAVGVEAGGEVPVVVGDQVRELDAGVGVSEQPEDEGGGGVEDGQDDDNAGYRSIPAYSRYEREHERIVICPVNKHNTT